MLRGFLSSGWREPGEIVVTSRRAERRDALAALYGVEATADNAAAIEGARLVILSVKPQDVVRVLAEITAGVSPEQTLLSVAAGVTTAAIESRLPEGARAVEAYYDSKVVWPAKSLDRRKTLFG